MPSTFKMRNITITIFSLLLLFFFPLSYSGDNNQNPEAVILLQLKSSLTLPTPDPLPDWSPSATFPPCSNSNRKTWAAVFCNKGSVSGLRLGNLDLSGSSLNLDPLKSLSGLRSISLVNNRLSGPIPAFSTLDGIRSIYLSNNSFSGEIPDDFFNKLDRLKKLYLDGNQFTGKIPSSMLKATSLIELQLQNNQFSGLLPDLDIPPLLNFSVAGNKLTGHIPPGLGKKFKADSFEGNPDLCGPPLSNPCKDVAPEEEEEEEEKSGGTGKTVAIVIVLIAVVGAMIMVGLVAVRRKQENREFESLNAMPDAEAMEAAAAVEASQKRVAAAGGEGSSHRRGGSSRGSTKGGGAPNLVMVNEERGVFGLPDLMKAAAEVLGNGGMGSAYKAVMGNGVAVAVKRMREMNRVGREGFDGEMRKYGKLKHKNVLPPLAYLYRRDEKLVVSEYVSKGSLLYLLHGDRGPDHAALDWPARLKIIRGITRGMSYLHTQLSTIDVPHANLKSSNVLLTPEYDPIIVDYGFITLVNPAHAPSVLFAYKSPEAIAHNHVSPKSDVYCLGVLILEILTGKFPSQYLNNAKGGTDVVEWAKAAVEEGKEAEVIDPNVSSAKEAVEEMVKVLRIGVMCVEESLEERPAMRQVAEMVEEFAKSSRLVEGVQRQASQMERTESIEL